MQVLDIEHFGGAFRVWLANYDVEVYCDIDRSGKVKGGTFKADSASGLKAAELAREAIREEYGASF